MKRFLPKHPPEPFFVFVGLMIINTLVSFVLVFLVSTEVATIASMAGYVPAFVIPFIYDNYLQSRKDRHGNRSPQAHHDRRTGRPDPGVRSGGGAGAGTGATGAAGGSPGVGTWSLHLPHASSSKWTIGWKTANLMLSSDGSKIAFVQVRRYGLHQPYGVTAHAVCNVKPHHVVPHEEPDDPCHCGFNAFHEADDATAYFQAPWRATLNLQSLVLLRVGLSGSVISGTFSANDKWGYRASEQTVANVFVPQQCTTCGRDIGADEVGWLTPADTQDYDGYRYLMATCQEHTTPSSLTLEQIAALSEVDFRWHANLKTGDYSKLSAVVDGSILDMEVDEELEELLLSLSASKDLHIQQVIGTALELQAFLSKEIANGSKIYAVSRPWWKLWMVHKQNITKRVA